MSIYSYISNVIIWTFFLTDFLFRKGKAAASFKRSATDRSSTIAIVASYAIILISVQVFEYFQIGSFSNSTASLFAVIVMVLGYFIRIFSMLKLRSGYTRILQVKENQNLYTESIYSIIRHPGYLGSLLLWIFFGLGIGNYWVSILAFIILIPVYFYRIKTEEKMLVENFGVEYLNYQSKTFRLVPFIW